MDNLAERVLARYKGRLADGCDEITAMRYAVIIANKHPLGSAVVTGSSDESVVTNAHAPTQKSLSDDERERLRWKYSSQRADARKDCPWKCKPDDAKCLCAKSTQKPDVNNAYESILKNLPTKPDSQQEQS